MVTCNPQGELGNVWLVELDMQGNILWQQCYGGSDYEAGFDITETDDGYIFAAVAYSNDGDVSGHHGTFGLDGKPDIWIVKLDTLGEIMWQKCLGGTGTDYSSAIFENNSGEILVFGETSSNDGDVCGNNSNPDEFDIWLAKLDANGVLLNQKCFGGKRNDYLNNHSVVKINDYRYIISSETTHGSGDVLCTFPDTYDSDAWFFEIKDCDYYAPAIPSQPAGPVWVYTSVASQNNYSIPPAANSNGYMWELSPASAGTLNSDSTMATVAWNSSYKGTAGIRVFNFNECGSSAWSDTLYVHVDTTLTIIEPVESSLIVYPNPSQDYVVFELKKPLPSGTITITDIMGRAVASMPLSGEKTVWQTSGLKAGVYLYHILTHEGLSSGKLIISP